jgi:hypothetical protein
VIPLVFFGEMNVTDFSMLAAAFGFGVTSWLLVVLCDRLMGGKR